MRLTDGFFKLGNSLLHIPVILRMHVLFSLSHSLVACIDILSDLLYASKVLLDVGQTVVVFFCLIDDLGALLLANVPPRADHLGGFYTVVGEFLLQSDHDFFIVTRQALPLFLGKPAGFDDCIYVFEVLAGENHRAERTPACKHAVSSDDGPALVGLVTPYFFKLLDFLETLRLHWGRCW